MPENDIPKLLEYWSEHFEFCRFFLPYGERELPGSAPVQPWDRLIFILSGEKVEPMELDGEIRHVRLRAGDSYLIMRNRNEFQSWLTPHKLLCVLPRPDCLRVAVHDVAGNAGGFDPRWTTASRHTGQPPGSALLAVFAALKERRNAAGDHVPLLLRAALKLAAQECRETRRGGGKALDTFNCISTYLENHFHEPLTREQVAKRFGLNPQYVSQLFTAVRGESFLDYLTRCRMERAKELLRCSRLTVKEVAMHSGFKTEIYFIRRFRLSVGTSPGRYRLLHSAKEE